MGVKDNKHVLKIEHSNTIQDCSCKGIINLIYDENLHLLDSCLKTGADFHCSIEYIEEHPITFGIYTEIRKSKIIPYDFAEMIKSHKVLSLLNEYRVWSSKDRLDNLCSLYHLTKQSRESESIDSITMFIDSLGSRSLFHKIHDNAKSNSIPSYENISQVRDVVVKSIKYNVPCTYDYFFSNYECLDSLSSDRHDRTTRYYYLGAILNNSYPTIELYEYFLSNGILRESDLRIQIDNRNSKWNKSHSKDKKTLIKYFKAYFELGEASLKERSKLHRKMKRYRSRLNQKNQLKLMTKPKAN